jgi:hypothetical protein
MWATWDGIIAGKIIQTGVTDGAVACSNDVDVYFPAQAVSPQNRAAIKIAWN